MPHYPDEDLRKIALPDSTREFMDENPHLHRRFAKIYVELTLESANKAAAYEIQRVKDKFQKTIESMKK